MPDKLKELQDVFDAEAKKYDVLPLDNSTLARWNTPRPSLTAGRTRFTLYRGVLTGVPNRPRLSILNKAYTITAEVEIPEGGAEGMIVTEGGRFGGYGLFLSKGVAGLRSGKPVFLYNLLNRKRTIWDGPELDAGKHTIVFDYKRQSPGLARGEPACCRWTARRWRPKPWSTPCRSRSRRTRRFDVGLDTRTGVAMIEYRYDVPFKFTGKIDRLTFNLEPQAKAAPENKAELGTMPAPEPDPIDEASP